MLICRNQYVPRYVPAEERDLCNYFDQLKYEETVKNPNRYFCNVKVVNFDIIHHQYRDDPLEKSLNEHFAIKNKDFSKYPKSDKKSVTGSTLKNQDNVKQPIHIQKDIILNYFLNK